MSFPERYTLHLSRQAERDIEHILQDTLEKYGERQQRTYAAAIDAALTTMTDYPRIGHRRPDLSDRHLAFTVEEHVVVYTISGQRINVSRVLHGRMDFTRHVRHQRPSLCLCFMTLTSHCFYSDESLHHHS